MLGGALCEGLAIFLLVKSRTFHASNVQFPFGLSFYVCHDRKSRVNPKASTVKACIENMFAHVALCNTHFEINEDAKIEECVFVLRLASSSQNLVASGKHLGKR